MPTSVALGPRFESFVREQIASGRYNNVSEVLRAGLRLLEDAEKAREARLDELRAAVRAGLDSGEPLDEDAAFAEVERRIDSVATRHE